jgi:hypothetical protein
MDSSKRLQRIGWRRRIADQLFEREVAPGWTALLVPLPLGLLFAFASYSGGLLPWLGRHDVLRSVGVAAVAVAGFAAAYAATEARSPLVPNDRRRPVLRELGGPRVLSVALVFVCLFFLKGLGSYTGGPGSARVVETATWWGLPCALCCWTLAALTIARETEQSGTGSPAAPERVWKWLWTMRERRTVQVFAYAFLFGGTAVFAAAGTIPGLLWGTTADQQAWRGNVSAPVTAWYVAFILWAAAVLIVAWLYLLQAFRARPSGLPHAELRRAWHAVWTSAALAVLVGLYVLADQGVLSELVIDLVLALYALFFVLMMVDASAAARRRRVKSSLGRRVVAAFGVIVFAFAVASILHTSTIRAGMLALCIAVVVPLVPVAHRALYGIERLPREPTPEVDPLDSQHVVEPLLADAESRALLRSVLVRGRIS